MKKQKIFWSQVLKSKYAELHAIYTADKCLVATVYSVNMSCLNTYYQVEIKINSLIRPKKLVVRTRRKANQYIQIALSQVVDQNTV